MLAAGHAVRALTRPNSDTRNLAGLPVECVLGTLEDAASLAAAVQGCAAVFHVAADYRLWVPDPAAMYRANVEGTKSLMRAALRAGVERVVYTSSVAVLGKTADGTPADENTPVCEADMIGVYKHSKFLAEQAVDSLVREEGLPAVIVNPSTPIGARDIKPTPTGRILVDAVRGRLPAYIDTGLNVVDVEAVASGHLLAFEKGQIGSRYILGGENISLAGLLELIADKAGFSPPRLKLPRLPLFVVAAIMEAVACLTKKEPLMTCDSLRMAKKPMYYSSAKAITALGYQPTPAALAVESALHWFKANGYCYTKGSKF